MLFVEEAGETFPADSTTTADSTPFQVSKMPNTDPQPTWVPKAPKAPKKPRRQPGVSSKSSSTLLVDPSTATCDSVSKTTKTSKMTAEAANLKRKMAYAGVPDYLTKNGPVQFVDEYDEEDIKERFVFFQSNKPILSQSLGHKRKNLHPSSVKPIETWYNHYGTEPQARKMPIKLCFDNKAQKFSYEVDAWEIIDKKARWNRIKADASIHQWEKDVLLHENFGNKLQAFGLNNPERLILRKQVCGFMAAHGGQGRSDRMASQFEKRKKISWEAAQAGKERSDRIARGMTGRVVDAVVWWLVGDY